MLVMFYRSLEYLLGIGQIDPLTSSTEHLCQVLQMLCGCLLLGVLLSHDTLALL